MGAVRIKEIIEALIETMNGIAVNMIIATEYDFNSVIYSHEDFVLRLNYKAFYK